MVQPPNPAADISLPSYFGSRRTRQALARREVSAVTIRAAGQLPQWFREALEGDPTDHVPNKRSEPRHVFVYLARVRAEQDANAGDVSVRLFNVGTGGVGFTARQEFEPGARLILLPEGLPELVADETAVCVRVVHCTQTVQGYKIGCVIEPAR